MGRRPPTPPGPWGGTCEECGKVDAEGEVLYLEWIPACDEIRDYTRQNLSLELLKDCFGDLKDFIG